jgi:hypothetical protein
MQESNAYMFASSTDILERLQYLASFTFTQSFRAETIIT